MQEARNKLEPWKDKARAHGRGASSSQPALLPAGHVGAGGMHALLHSSPPYLTPPCSPCPAPAAGVAAQSDVAGGAARAGLFAGLHLRGCQARKICAGGGWVGVGKGRLLTLDGFMGAHSHGTEMGFCL